MIWNRTHESTEPVDEQGALDGAVEVLNEVDGTVEVHHPGVDEPEVRPAGPHDAMDFSLDDVRAATR